MIVRGRWLLVELMVQTLEVKWRFKFDNDDMHW